MSRVRAGERPQLRASKRLIQMAEWQLQQILLDIHDGPVQHMYAELSRLDLLRRALETTGQLGEELETRVDRVRSPAGIPDEVAFAMQECLWDQMESVRHLRPDSIGHFVAGGAVRRSHTLALTQLLVTYYLFHSAVAARTQFAPAAIVG